MQEFGVGETGHDLSLSPTLHEGEQKRLRREISNRVYQLAPDNKGARPLLFRVLYLALKEHFLVASYRDIKQCDLQPALFFISTWGNDIEMDRSEGYESTNQ